MRLTFYKTNFQFNALKVLACAVLLTTGAKSLGQNKTMGKLHVGFTYPVSTNGKHAALDTNNLSFHVLAGVSAAERGASFAGIANIVRNDTKGFQFAGISNHIGTAANGGLFSGVLNTYGGGNTVAVAGLANLSKNDTKGIQFSGFASIAKNISGTQVAGFINKAKDINGTQIAGFINIAKKVKGAQIAGFINVADSSDYPIGIINIVKNGEKSIGLTTDETLTTMLSFRSGGKVLYGIIGLGYNFKNSDEVYAFEAGLGAHFFQSNSFRLNAEITGIGLESFKAGEYFKTSFRLMPALKITRNLELFGGPSFNYVNTNTTEGRKLNKKYINTWENKKDNNFQAFYIGYSGGIQYSF
ncbi:hypothetical protein [Pedobacter nyackensis]|uniref:Uncharacterized protein n=1 Tax=Pedobacter nyackensis TaxID=475255 RepID=A0A1W2DT68_9SPHI|nr:hypothetical protein [Pedobacter nyackensis]SMD00613.1 hypothetical protein SAMN04488101_10853 [Pedobacter nyackensis]